MKGPVHRFDASGVCKDCGMLRDEADECRNEDASALASRVEERAREIERLNGAIADAAEAGTRAIATLTIERDHLAKVATEEEAAKERAALYVAERDREIAALKAEVERRCSCTYDEQGAVATACVRHDALQRGFDSLAEWLRDQVKTVVDLRNHVTLLRACREKWRECARQEDDGFDDGPALAADEAARAEGAIE